MTKRRAERLTGYEIRSVGANHGKVAYGAFRGEESVTLTEHVTEDLALEALVREVYRLNSLEVLKQHGWRCARCRSARRLQIHHRRYRSHGGSHEVDNLEPVCWSCHKLIHRQERSL
jgi:5-methylcytosine-specific restriction endonuclease McrA